MTFHQAGCIFSIPQSESICLGGERERRRGGEEEEEGVGLSQPSGGKDRGVGGVGWCPVLGLGRRVRFSVVEVSLSSNLKLWKEPETALWLCGPHGVPGYTFAPVVRGARRRRALVRD